jgi:hypothetical protein
VALLALAGASLFAGAWAGLVRIGVPLHAPNPETLAGHGAIMVGGLLGTLIGVERAVALDRRWAFAAPLASGLGTVAALAGVDWSIVTGLFVLASGVFVAANAAVTLRQLAVFTLVMLLGAVAWTAGNVAWAMGVTVERLVLLWAAFLGSRLPRAARAQPPARLHRRSPFGCSAPWCSRFQGARCSAVFERRSARIAGVSLVALTVRLVHDIALSRACGQPAGDGDQRAPRILLACAGWAAAGGQRAARAGAALRCGAARRFWATYFDGFGHAPIILPAVLAHQPPHAPLCMPRSRSCTARSPCA